MAAFTIAGVASVWLEISHLSLLDRLLAGEPSELGAVAMFQDALEVASVAYVLVVLAVIITFLAWLVRANRNLLAFGLPRKHGTKGVLGWWFVPFANLVQPYRVVSEVIHKSGTERSAPSLLLYTWWAAWISSGLIALWLMIVSVDLGSYRELRDLVPPSLVSSALLLVAGLALAAVVWWATQAQERRAAANETAPGGPIEQPKAQSGRTAWVVLSVVGLGLVVLALTGPVSSNITGFVGRPIDAAVSIEAGVTENRVSIYDVVVGDCFIDELENVIWVMHLSECGVPHEGQVFATFRHPDRSTDAFPGDEAMAEFAWRACLWRFEDAIGESYDTSPLDIWYFLPDQLSWGVGHRVIACLAADLEGELLEGSDLNGAPPSPGIIPSVGRDTASRP